MCECAECDCVGSTGTTSRQAKAPDWEEGGGESGFYRARGGAGLAEAGAAPGPGQLRLRVTTHAYSHISVRTRTAEFSF